MKVSLLVVVKMTDRLRFGTWETIFWLVRCSQYWVFTPPLQSKSVSGYRVTPLLSPHTPPSPLSWMCGTAKSLTFSNISIKLKRIQLKISSGSCPMSSYSRFTSQKYLLKTCQQQFSPLVSCAPPPLTLTWQMNWLLWMRGSHWEIRVCWYRCWILRLIKRGYFRKVD